MGVYVSSDSTCDLSREQLQQHNISLCALCVNKGGETFRDGVDIFPDDIYAHVAAGGDLCSTAATNPADYMEFFAAEKEGYDALIHLNIGSGFSSCFQNACLAAAETENVYAVDSQNLSTGHGHLVLLAAELAESGKTPEEIVDILNATAPKIRASFVLEQLEYMKKGGRCSTVAALGANLLKLKPCIEVRDGKMGVAKKYRGSLEKCLQEYVSEQLANLTGIRNHRIFVTHSGLEETIVQSVVDMVKDLGYFEEVCLTRAGCTVSSHCGPGTLGVLFIEK